jgi:hypothetical protein
LLRNPGDLDARDKGLRMAGESTPKTVALGWWSWPWQTQWYTVRINGKSLTPRKVTRGTADEWFWDEIERNWTATGVSLMRQDAGLWVKVR